MQPKKRDEALSYKKIMQWLPLFYLNAGIFLMFMMRKRRLTDRIVKTGCKAHPLVAPPARCAPCFIALQSFHRNEPARSQVPRGMTQAEIRFSASRAPQTDNLIQRNLHRKR